MTENRKDAHIDEKIHADLGDVKATDIYTKKSRKRMTLLTVIVVVLVIAINVAVAAIGDARLWYIDLTNVRYQSEESTMYTLSDQCKDLIGKEAIPLIKQANVEREKKGLEPIKLKIIFCSDKDIVESDGMLNYVSHTARALAKEYADCIEVEYINITKNPSAIQKYKTTSSATIYESNVIVEFGTEYIVQKVTSFFYQDATADKPWAYNGEQRLSAVILSLTQAESPICAITNNHGETLFDERGNVKEQYTSFIKLISGAGYEVRFIDLEKEDIPEKCRMIIAFSPTSDFKAFGNLGENNVSEIEKLDKYLDGDNAFFYICDRSTPSLPNIDEYLEEWGIRVTRVASAAGIKENYAIKDYINSTDSGVGDVVVGKYETEALGGSITEDMRKSAYPPRVLFGSATSITAADSYTRMWVDADEESGELAYSYYNYYRNGTNRNMFDVFTTHNTALAQVGGEDYEVAIDNYLFKLMTITQEDRSIQENSYNSINNASYVMALASTDFCTNAVLDSTAFGNTDVLLAALRSTAIEVIPANVSLKAFYIYDMADDAAYASNKPEVWVACLTLIPLGVAFAVGVTINVRRRYR